MLKWKINLYRTKRMCKQNGWQLRSYVQGEKLIRQYRLDSDADDKLAFTFHYGDDYFILYNDNMPIEVQAAAICHEIAHIKYNHFTSNIDNKTAEADANRFSKSTLHKFGVQYNTAVGVLIAVNLLVFGTVFAIHSRPDSVVPVVHTITSTTTISATDGMVYITRTGTKYHRADCRHIQGYDVIEISAGQAQSIYEPCKDCHPND